MNRVLIIDNIIVIEIIAFEWMMRLSMFTVKNKNIWQNWWHGFYTNQKLWDGVISVSTTPTFLQWSPNIDWLSTVHCDWPVCLSVWVSVLSMFAAHRAPVSQPSPSSDWHWVAQQVWFGSPWPGPGSWQGAEVGGGLTIELREATKC